jgi:low temperature requirement protein LtrA
MNINRIVSIAIYGFAFLMTIVMFGYYFTGSTKETQEGSSTDIGFYAMYVLTILTMVSVVLGGVVGALNNPRSLIASGVAVVGGLVIFFISYGMSDAEVTSKYKEFFVGPGLSQMIGGGLIMTYILFFIAFLVTLFSIVYSAVTNR